MHVLTKKSGWSFSCYLIKGATLNKKGKLFIPTLSWPASGREGRNEFHGITGPVNKKPSFPEKFLIPLAFRKWQMRAEGFICVLSGLLFLNISRAKNILNAAELQCGFAVFTTKICPEMQKESKTEPKGFFLWGFYFCFCTGRRFTAPVQISLVLESKKRFRLENTGNFALELLKKCQNSPPWLTQHVFISSPIFLLFLWKNDFKTGIGSE